MHNSSRLARSQRSRFDPDFKMPRQPCLASSRNIDGRKSPLTSTITYAPQTVATHRRSYANSIRCVTEGLAKLQSMPCGIPDFGRWRERTVSSTPVSLESNSDERYSNPKQTLGGEECHCTQCKPPTVAGHVRPHLLEHVCLLSNEPRLVNSGTSASMYFVPTETPRS